MEGCAAYSDDAEDEDAVVREEETASDELTAKSARARDDVELTTKERAVYELHMAGANPSQICKNLKVSVDRVNAEVKWPLAHAMRKGCAFYYNRLDIPEALTLWFNDFVVLNGRGPKMDDITSQHSIAVEDAQIHLIMMAVKYARDQEHQRRC